MYCYRHLERIQNFFSASLGHSSYTSGLQDKNPSYHNQLNKPEGVDHTLQILSGRKTKWFAFRCRWQLFHVTTSRFLHVQAWGVAKILVFLLFLFWKAPNSMSCLLENALLSCDYVSIQYVNEHCPYMQMVARKENEDWPEFEFFIRHSTLKQV